MFESFYILDNNLLSDMSFANLFSQCVAEFLIVLTISFKSRHFFTVMKSNFSFFFLSWIMSLVLYLKKTPLYLRSFRFSLIFSSRNLLVLHFTFISMIHLELIFVKLVRQDMEF